MPITAEKTEKKGKAALTEYNAFLRSLKLFTIYLKEATYDIDRSAYWEHKERKLEYKMTAEPIDIGDGYFDVRSRLEATMSGGKPKINLIKISVTFDLHFHAETIPKALVKEFCDSDIQLIVRPYFREYVSNVTSRMHVPPVILPLSTEQED